MIFIEIFITNALVTDFFSFAMIFDRLDLETEKESDNMPGHFWYLLVLKRSFLGLPAAWNEVRRSQFCVEDGENHQISGLSICTSPLKGIPAMQFPKNRVSPKSDRLLAKTGIPKVVDGTETATNDVGHQLSFLDQFETQFEPK